MDYNQHFSHYCKTNKNHNHFITLMNKQFLLKIIKFHFQKTLYLHLENIKFIK